MMKMPWKLMKEAGFRFILLGVEWPNQETLDKINKVQDASTIVVVIKSGYEAGLDMHGTFMSAYPWESENDEQRTIDLSAIYYLRKGILKMAFRYPEYWRCLRPEINLSVTSVFLKYFDVYKDPEFIFRKIKNIKNLEDFAYLIRGGRLVIEEKLRKCLKR